MKLSFQILAAAALAAVAFNTSAATQGSVGSTSNGTVDITLEVAKQIIVKDLQDLPLTTNGATPGQPIEGSETFCVGGIGFPDFSVELISSAAINDGEYFLSDGANLLEYNVAFANDTSASTLADGASPSLGSNAVPGTFGTFGNLGCTSDNSTVVVSVPSTVWESATVAGNYTDTLTVTVAAN